MAQVLVKNLKGTSENVLPSVNSSWIDFWEKKKGKKHEGCEVSLCSVKTNIVGGHVKKVGETAKEYIVPLCSQCNNYSNEEEFKVWESDLIPVVE